MVYRETFLQIQIRHLQHIIRRNWIHGVPVQKSRFIIRPQRKRVRGKHKILIRDASLDRQPKIQSSSVEETLQRIMGQTNNDCRFQILILTNSLHQSRLFIGRKDSRLHWIKEVVMVDWVDDSMSSSSIRGIQIPNFEVLDAKIASALNRIIHNSHCKRRISLEEHKAQKEDRFLRGIQTAYLIYEYCWVTGANDSVENNVELITMCFEMMVIRNSIQSGMEFYCPWLKSNMLTSWKGCTNKVYESLRNSRPYWSCMTWRFIRRE